jgi:cytosine/adenosine deaminase-related metal-dependent hydrolase
MILNNLAIRGMSPIPDMAGRIVFEGGRIRGIQPAAAGYSRENNHYIHFTDAVAFPGLINSHDHLDFNLFPLLANQVYNNYTDWARDIQQSKQKEISAILRIPEDVRIEWGCYKNLLNGFTTVVNHGKKVMVNDSPVHVYQSCTSLHSTAFERNWRWKLNNPFNTSRIVAMHIGEGNDEMAGKEINSVTRWNFFRKKIVAVHGIAMNKKQAGRFEGLIWCPASNELLIGATAAVKDLGNKVPVVFGTDSTLSSGWNVWEHFRLGLKQSGITEQNLLDMLTSLPAQLWGMKGRGSLKENTEADMVIAEQKAGFFENNPENILMVIQKGKVRMYDESLAGQIQLPFFSKVTINKRVKFVEGDLPGLIRKIRSSCPSIDLPVSI